MTTTIKITELSDIGANLASSTVIPVVNMSGTPTTQKTVVGNIANLVLAGAGGVYAAAAAATIANTVTDNAQPNITTVGTLSYLSVTGNVAGGNITTSNLVRGTIVTALDQLNTANLSSNGLATIARINVTNTANLGNVGNVIVTGGTSGQVLSTDGSGHLSWTTISSGSNTGNIGFNNNVIYSNLGVVINNSDLGNGQTAGLSIPVQGGSDPVNLFTTYGNVNILAGDIGNNQPEQIWTFNSNGNLTLTNGSTIKDNVGTLSQGPAVDTNNISSVIGTFPSLNVTAPNGVVAGWTVNGPGVTNAIVLGIDTNNKFVEIDGGTFQVGQSYTFTGPSAGVAGVIVTANSNSWNFSSDGSLLFPDGARLYDDDDGINLGGYQSEFTDKVVQIVTNGTTTGEQVWRFDYDGNTTFPDGTVIQGDGSGIYYPTNNGWNLHRPDNLVWIGSGTNVAYIDTYSPNVSVRLRTLGDPEEGPGYDWIFDPTGNLTLPGNTFAVNYANGDQVQLGGGGANTGNVTFNDVNIIGDGNLYLQPDPTNASAYLDIYLTGGPDIHIAGNGENLILGRDEGANVSVQATGNVAIQANAYISGTPHHWTFAYNGNLEIPGNIVGPASANLVIYANAGVHEFTFGSDGTFYAPDNVVLGGTSIAIGPGADVLVGEFANAVLVASSNSEAYIQGIIYNVSDNGSADWVAQGHRSDDAGGWTDMGFTSSGFGDANYSITGQGDGYLFAQSFYNGQAPGGRGGNLVLATGENGTVNDIIFATGGFLASNEFMRISHANNSVELYDGGNITGANVINANTFAINNGTDGNVESTGNVNIISNGNTWNFSTTGNLTTPGDISIRGANIGFPGQYGNINWGPNANTYGMNFSQYGFAVLNTDLYSNANTIGSNVLMSNSVVISGNANVSGNLVLASATQIVSTPGSNGNITLDPDGTGVVKVLGNVVANNFSGNINITGNVTGTSPNVTLVAGSYSYTFDNTGNFTLPANSDIVMTGTNSILSAGGTALLGGYSQVGGSYSTLGVKYPGAGTQFGITLQPTNDNTTAIQFLNAAGNSIGNIKQTSSTVQFVGDGSQLSNVATTTTGSWTLAAGTNTVSLTVPINGTYSIWVRGNIPNGIVTYTATVVVTNTNVPVLGSSYGWYYAAGNALVLTAIPTQIVGNVNNISNAVVSTTTANVFTFGITNNSGTSQVVSYGYTELG